MIVIAPKGMKYFKKQGDRLRLVVTLGERLVNVRGEGFRLLEIYGTTETLALSTYFWVEKNYENTPIGKAAPGMAVYLLDENDKPVEDGEICIAGDVGYGYLNLVEQTAKTFRSNPFKEQDGFDMLVHTGDLGRLLPDGNIEYVNRKDWMVKINGQRVEPGEIEAELRTLEGITDAAVKDFTDKSVGFAICISLWLRFCGPLRFVMAAWLDQGHSDMHKRLEPYPKQKQIVHGCSLASDEMNAPIWERRNL